MSLLAVTCLTGWMQGLDAFWGVEWVQETHEMCANLILAMAAVHVAGGSRRKPGASRKSRPLP